MGIPSAMTNRKNRQSDNPKLISEDTFFENKKRYFGTLTFVKIPELLSNAIIPVDVDSLK